MGGSLLGAAPTAAAGWAKRYLRVRQLDVTLDEFVELGLAQVGTNPVLTKTKLRRAAKALARKQGIGATRQAS